MSFISKLFGRGVKEVTEGVGSLAIDIREAIKGKEYDPETLLKLEEQRIGLQEKQIAVNVQDSKSKSLLVSGWRPFIGWVSGVSIGTYFIPQFIMASFLWSKACLEQGVLVAYPELDARNHLFELVIALLGFGLYRTAEKVKNVNNK